MNNQNQPKQIPEHFLNRLSATVAHYHQRFLLDIVSSPRTAQQYVDKFRACSVKTAHAAEVKRAVDRLVLQRDTFYLPVGNAVGLPWQLVACLHWRESSMSFLTYLHNGDPLRNSDGKPVPTVHVPKGKGPFNPQNWVTAATDALGGKGAHQGLGWGPGHMLQYAELYNGLGYRYRNLPSPYVWSFTDQYVRGKFGSDGHYNPELVDGQIGVAALLKGLLPHFT